MVRVRLGQPKEISTVLLGAAAEYLLNGQGQSTLPYLLLSSKHILLHGGVKSCSREIWWPKCSYGSVTRAALRTKYTRA